MDNYSFGYGMQFLSKRYLNKKDEKLVFKLFNLNKYLSWHYCRKILY